MKIRQEAYATKLQLEFSADIKLVINVPGLPTVTEVRESILSAVQKAIISVVGN